MGFSNVTILPRQPGLDAAIDRGGHQCLATLELGRVNNQAAIGRETGPFIRTGVCDGLISDASNIAKLLSGICNFGFSTFITLHRSSCVVHGLPFYIPRRAW